MRDRAGHPHSFREGLLEGAAGEHRAAGEVSGAAVHAPASALHLDVDRKRQLTRSCRLAPRSAPRSPESPRAQAPFDGAHLDLGVHVHRPEAARHWGARLAGMVVRQARAELHALVEADTGVNRRDVELAIPRHLPEANADTHVALSRRHDARVVEPCAKVANAGARGRAIEVTAPPRGRWRSRRRGGRSHRRLVLVLSVGVAVALRGGTRRRAERPAATA